MTEERSPEEALGPSWMWMSAWSLQGLCVVAVTALGLESEALGFVVTGALAGIPLIGLRAALRRRAEAEG